MPARRLLGGLAIVGSSDGTRAATRVLGVRTAPEPEERKPRSDDCNALDGALGLGPGPSPSCACGPIGGPSPAGGGAVRAVGFLRARPAVGRPCGIGRPGGSRPPDDV